MAIDKKKSVLDVLLNIDARISHIEDIAADHRNYIVKLVKQSNKIVTFLKDLEIQEVEVDDSFQFLPETKEKDEKSLKLQQLLDEFINKKEELKEFEKELKRHKDKLTPGQVGEA
tara:strand:+ start:161 stop:505 length:345 start_codon:yes stop_codon:yes gene_type:complete